MASIYSDGTWARHRKAGRFGGQFVFVVPAKNMIIVTFGDDNVSTDQANINDNIMIGILHKHLF